LPAIGEISRQQHKIVVAATIVRPS
jgi:hypothetical protein